MATTIKLKNSVTTTNAPTSLVQGEVAINITDKKVWVGNAATTPVLLLGSGADGTFTNLTVSGVASFADGTVSLPSITNIGDTNTGIFFPAADTIAFSEGGVESMRIDSAGNLGLGVTPSAWQSTRKALQIGAQSSISSEAAATLLALNFYADSGGTSRYIGTGNASLYNQFSGNHVWYTAPSGTAGGAVSLSESMRIDSSGNVGIGTSSPTAPLTVVNSVVGEVFRLTSAAANIYGLASDGTISTYTGGVLTGTGGFVGTSSAHPYIFRTNNTERMRIDSSGNLLIGKTSAVYSVAGRGVIEIGGSSESLLGFTIGSGTTNAAYLYNNASSLEMNVTGSRYLFWTVNGAERMRIDSTGALLVGTTTADGRISAETTGNVITSKQNASGGWCYKSNAANNSGTYYHIEFLDGGVTHGSITSNGTNTAYNTSSDVRLKDNIVDAHSAISAINSIQIRSFNWKTNNKHQEFGVIAQELIKVFPDAVTKGQTEEDTWGVDTSIIVPAMIKALQEQQAMIENLTTRLNALEGK